jgi:hypothetical protein
MLHQRYQQRLQKQKQVKQQELLNLFFSGVKEGIAAFAVVF